MKGLWAIAGGSTLVYLVLALMMAVIPGYELSRTPPGPHVAPLTPLEAKGREVYAANGCGYCHTQQVRPLAQDQVFGRPSAPGDFAYQTPELLGSERTGPDLTNVGARQASEVWQFLHLYNPRIVVPDSIMPSFPWMFRVVDRTPAGVNAVPLSGAFRPAQGVVVPGPGAQALVAYLLSLKQPPLAAGAADAAESATPPTQGITATTPASAGSAGSARVTGAAQTGHGQQLFIANCSACHQASGEGLRGVFPSLKGDAVVNNPDPTQQIHTVLFGLQGGTIGGVQYASPMPPFGSALSDQDVAELIDYERGAWANHGKPAAPADVAAVRARGK
jgi:cytochrome c oxidase cbb3-type subunit 2